MADNQLMIIKPFDNLPHSHSFRNLNDTSFTVRAKLISHRMDGLLWNPQVNLAFLTTFSQSSPFTMNSLTI